MNRRIFCSSLMTAPALIAAQRDAAGTAPQHSRLLFASSAIHELYLQLDARDCRRLREMVTSNDYYPAAVSWNGMSLSSVRLRARGRSSRNSGKPSLRIDLRPKGGKSPLERVDGFVLNNLANDPSALHDWLAMKLFRKAGVAAPRRSFARVFINREEAGLFGIGEEIDSRFLRRHFREDSGSLYQYHADESKPQRQPKKAARARAILHAERPDLAANPRHLAAVLAAESFCADQQGLLSQTGADGLYFYNAKKPAAAYVIPWGKELAFSNWQTPAQNGAGPLAALLLSQPVARELHRATTARLSSLAGPGGWLESKIQDRAYVLRALVAADPHRSLAAFDAAIADLMEFARHRNSSSLAQ